MATNRRAGVRWVVSLALAAGLGTAITACGGGSGSSTTTATIGPTAVATDAPHAQPTIDGSSFNFPAHGYAATIPDGWHANPNSLIAGPQTVDTFFAADTVDGVQPNISVACEQNAGGTATAEFAQTRLATLQKLGATDLTALDTVTVSGVQAQRVSYALTRGTVALHKTDVMIATAACGWTLAVASAPGDASQFSDVFDKFLASFTLSDTSPPSATPTL